MHAARFAVAVAVAGALATTVSRAQDFTAWKETAKFKLAAPASLAAISDDKTQVLTLHPAQHKVFTGGLVPKVWQTNVLEAHSVGTGASLFSKDLGEVGGQFSYRANRLALVGMADKVTVYDVKTWNTTSVCDCRNPSDEPPGANKGLPDAFKDFSGGGRIGDVEMLPDGKTLVVVRMESGEWKQLAKGAFQGSSYQQVVFWDADRGERIGKLDCEDKNANDGSLYHLASRNQVLVKFSNNFRLLDVAKKQWGVVVPVEELYALVVSSDEKIAAVSSRDQTVRIVDLDTGKILVTFKEKVINKTPRIDGSLTPNKYEFGPSLQFVPGDRALKVTLNDGKTVVYRDVAKGEKLATAPLPEDLRLTGRVLAVSRDKLLAVTSPTRTSPQCTIWTREAVASSSKKGTN